MRSPFLHLAVLLCVVAHASGFASNSDDLRSIETSIRTELETHGNRAIGKNAMHWSTRLQQIADCRASFTVQTSTNYGEPSVRLDRLSFSLAALDPYNVDVQKNWLELGCFYGEKCVFSTSICAESRRDGLTVDCTSASHKRSNSMRINFDGDLNSASRLQHAFQKAIKLCRESKSVPF